MSTIELKEELYKIIDGASDKQLEIFYDLLQLKEDRQYKYTPEEIAMFEELEAEYLRGEDESYTMEESFEIIRKNKM